MKTHHILTGLVVALSAISCGTQNAANNTDYSSSIIQTEFYRADFGDRYNRVWNKVNRLNPHRTNNSSIILQNQEYGGFNWDYVIFYFTHHRFYSISFTTDYYDENGARVHLENIYRRLSMKYVGFEPNTETEGYSFIDSANNMVNISMYPSSTPSGTKWVCSLVYIWGEGLSMSVARTLNEL